MLRTNPYVSYYRSRYLAHLVFAERQAPRRQGAGVAEVCHRCQVLNVARRSCIPQSIDRGHEELKG